MVIPLLSFTCKIKHFFFLHFLYSLLIFKVLSRAMKTFYLVFLLLTSGVCDDDDDDDVKYISKRNSGRMTALY